MAWSWSHTEEAYENARLNTHDLSQEELAVILAEWDATTPDEDYGYSGGDLNDFDSEAYERALVERLKLPQDELAAKVWDLACDLRTCDNGGWNAWLCPYGCHTVPFDREGDDEAEPPPAPTVTVTTMTHAQIRACPHFIIDPSHYRPDGSCRCDDPEHTVMRPWGYRWREDLGRWAA